jgi:hypothetical protein
MKIIRQGNSEFMKKLTNRQVLFAAVTHLEEGLRLETSLTLIVEKSLIC